MQMVDILKQPQIVKYSNLCYVENMSCCIHYSAPLVLFICGPFS